MRARAIAMAALALVALSACDAVSAVGVWCQFPVDCHRPNECSYSRCRARCVLGSDCPTHLCLAGHCAVEQDRGCTTIPGRTCADALVCAEDRCTLRCTTSCAGGALCRPAVGASGSICVDPSEAPPVSDGAITDAGHDGA